ncbi:MAG: CoB--CoM heterodisulfide reductase iron-sulfur subunit A family protein [Candidatus Hodarchaeales archaeon]
MESKSDQTSFTKEKSPRAGVYICHCGGNISDVVDVEKVQNALEKDPQVYISRRNMFMCSKTGQELIEKDIKDGLIDRVIVASCSPKLHETTFRGATKRGGLNVFLYEHANTREQVSWAHPHTPEKATEKAISLIRAAVNKAIEFEPLKAIKIPTTKRVMVIGGGVAGLRAANDLADSGLAVELIEKSPFLGGRMASLDRIFPTNEVASESLTKLIVEVIENPLITVHLNTTVEKASGYIGNFEVSLKEHISRGLVGHITEPELRIAMNACPVVIPNELKNDGSMTQKALLYPKPGHYPHAPAIDWNYCTKCGECKKALGNSSRIHLDSGPRSIDISAGVIILATGFDYYLPYEGEYGWSKYPNVITLPQFIRMFAPGGKFENKLEWDDHTIKTIAFIHCVGSRQVGGDFLPGQNCEDQLNEYCSRVCCTASLQAVNELKNRFPNVKLYNLYRDIRTYGRYHEEDYYDTASKNGVVFIKYLPDSLPAVYKPQKFSNPLQLNVKVKDQLTFGEELEIPADLIVLAVGMTTRNQQTLVQEFNLPVGNDRFLLEVHPKLRPVEVANSGIMLGGTCQAPFDVTETTSAALAAASKAAIILSKEFAELDPYVAHVNPELCTGCGACLDECGYLGTLQLVEMEVNGQMVQRAQVNSALCKGCGACVAECPVSKAIDVKGYTLASLERMIDGFVEEVNL